ncbi:MAG: DUF4419 domain-containing protein [Planctomycetota bacterium]|nr:DUF4419 domain-containing protein [Planctomycetota bacterium]
MTVTFEVSPVQSERGPFPRQPFRLGFERHVGSAVEACGGRAHELVDEVGWGEHPFLGALFLAFQNHLPLVLRPDDIWLLLAQGWAQHVKSRAEELRERFVGHEGRLLITIRRDDFRPSAENPWPAVFGAFSDAISRAVGRKRDLVVADFSTTGPAERAASEIVLLDAMQSYFSYELRTFCGIPRITLLGTTDDWRSIQERARCFGEVGLEPWVGALEPLLEEFVRASSGRTDSGFWESFYKFEGTSGGPYVTGWVNAFFPWICEGGELASNPFALRWSAEAGPRPEQFPTGMSKAPFVWDCLGTRSSMELLGGFAGVSQDADSLALRPEIGWAVRPATSQTVAPEVDVATGRQVRHVCVLGARGPGLDGVLAEVRRRSHAVAVGDAWFDVRSKDLILRVHRGAPDGVVPSSLILVVSGRDKDWATMAEAAGRLERTLLAAGRLRELPKLGLVDGFVDDDDFKAMPVTVRVLTRHVHAFYEFSADGVLRHLEEVAGS